MVHQTNQIIPKPLRMNVIGYIEAQAGFIP